MRLNQTPTGSVDTSLLPLALAPDVLFEIFGLLFLPEALKLRAVCKYCASAVEAWREGLLQLELSPSTLSLPVASILTDAMLARVLEFSPRVRTLCLDSLPLVEFAGLDFTHSAIEEVQVVSCRRIAVRWGHLPHFGLVPAMLGVERATGLTDEACSVCRRAAFSQCAGCAQALCVACAGHEGARCVVCDEVMCQAVSMLTPSGIPPRVSSVIFEVPDRV